MSISRHLPNSLIKSITHPRVTRLLLMAVVMMACTLASSYRAQAFSNSQLKAATSKPLQIASVQDSVSGMVFNDLDYNGINSAEPALAGWVIQLRTDSATGNIINQAITGIDGRFKFFIDKGMYYET